MPPSELALPEMLNLTGRKVLVTGAANGIGQATAIAFGELGATLVLTDWAVMNETADKLTKMGFQHQCISGDIADQAFHDRLLGEGPYFALANVAAAFFNKAQAEAKQHFDHVMNVNLYGPMMLANKAVDQMAENGGGHIVLVGSLAGRHGGISVNNNPDYAAYAASKGALHTAVKWLSRRAITRGVNVNCVAPGPTDTQNSVGVAFEPQALPLGRMGTAEELGWSIALLCTPAAGFISGVVLDVNGGAYVAP